MAGDFDHFIFLNLSVFLKQGNITSFVFQAQTLHLKKRKAFTLSKRGLDIHLEKMMLRISC